MIISYYPWLFVLMADAIDGSSESTGEPCKAAPDAVQDVTQSTGREVGGGGESKASYSPSTHGFPPSRPVFKHSSVLAPSRVSSSLFPLRSSVLTFSPPTPAKPLVLRPSQLAVGSDAAKIATSLEATQLSNPFAKAKNSDAAAEQSEPATACRSEPVVGTTSSPSTPKFVPLGTKSPCREESMNPSLCVAPIASPAPGFVFGQNLQERVAETVPTESAAHTPADGSSQTNNVVGDAIATTNGTEEMLFTSVLKKEHQSDSSSNQSERPVKSLDQAAREYEEARSVKRKYDQVMVVTGEEDEANVLQINCKLFAFSKVNSTWTEHGRGTLRLNDKEDENGVQSRVVVRMTGSLRVLLNTKVWTGMTVERASQKSVRLTAQDSDGQIKVFLVMATPKEAEHLYSSLSARVARLCSQQQSSASVSSKACLSEPSPKKSLVADNCVLDMD
ncbi:ran-binding protein 3 isoform X2 [Bacillus rossius redtenbacheri]|uniref:ran-binding protein 3 isoform X2 n=1 Tax=Bacillus rossius redtenbacheri TaxID=93214 RepID=UPI002FDE151E